MQATFAIVWTLTNLAHVTNTYWPFGVMEVSQFVPEVTRILNALMIRICDKTLLSQLILQLVQRKY